jgi:hypothetical protein
MGGRRRNIQRTHRKPATPRLPSSTGWYAFRIDSKRRFFPLPSVSPRCRHYPSRGSVLQTHRFRSPPPPSTMEMRYNNKSATRARQKHAAQPNRDHRSLAWDRRVPSLDPLWRSRSQVGLPGPSYAATLHDGTHSSISVHCRTHVRHPCIPSCTSFRRCTCSR